ncbi:ComEC/Rec2 family competence protein [Clostridium massiliamazoniense]|uniref:ComEC/Rec2 family competence protein n=1 Tax=Clostridium massiliamazoniense TaxID=1347366 RepID=UPI0006D809CB|nr:ComEC/Rec2 family competence protein [Clostridium massiliamazoniense]
MFITLLIFCIFLCFLILKFNILNLKKFSKPTLTFLTLTLTITLLVGCGTVNESKIKLNENINNNIAHNSISDNNKDDNATTQRTSKSSIHFIDTGNSDAILITGEKNVLIDGGDNDDEDSLVSYLNKQGVKTLDYIIATHPDADHIGALDAVIKNIDVKNLLVANGSKDTKTYRDFITAAANKKLPPSVPIDGKKFELGNNSYMMLFNSNGGSDANEQSLVTLYVNGNDKALFMGDAGEETEHEILNNLEDVDLIKIGHHGSRTSTSAELLNKVNPEFAVITVGEGNSYGHPHIETMDKLKSKNLKLHRTDQCGTIVFTSTGNGLKTNCKEGNYESGKKKNIEDTKKEENSITSKQNNTTNNSNNNTINSSNNKEVQFSSNNSNGNKQVQSSSNKNNESQSANNTNSKTVYLSATGSKYHSKNNCGKMNPNTARAVSLESVIGKYDPCSKCY